MKVLIISARREIWESLAPTASAHGLCPVVLETVEKGLEAMASCPPVAVILDLPAGAHGDRDAHIRELRAALFSFLRINASVHAAAVSFLSEDVFHDVFEGFGLLCSLPPTPVAADMERFAATLGRVVEGVRASGQTG